MDFEKIANQLFEGKCIPKELSMKNGGQDIALIVSQRIDEHRSVPSKCAHAMCCSSANGAYKIVQTLCSYPPSTFNRAYNFGEPLRRACRAWSRSIDPSEKENLKKCAIALVETGADLDAPDKYLKSKISAAQSVLTSKHSEKEELLAELRELSSQTKKKTKREKKINLEEQESKLEEEDKEEMKQKKKKL